MIGQQPFELPRISQATTNSYNTDNTNDTNDTVNIGYEFFTISTFYFLLFTNSTNSTMCRLQMPCRAQTQGRQDSLNLMVAAAGTDCQ